VVTLGKPLFRKPAFLAILVLAVRKLPNARLT